MLKYKTNQPLSAKNLYPHNDTGAPKTGPCVTPNSVCDALDTWSAPHPHAHTLMCLVVAAVPPPLLLLLLLLLLLPPLLLLRSAQLP